jgi:hypothetical protein
MSTTDTATNLETEWGPTIAYSRLCGLVEAMDRATTEMHSVFADWIKGETVGDERLARVKTALSEVEKARTAHQETKAWALSTATGQEVEV